MSFTGAPNVIHVSTNGSPTNSGADWANAVDSLSSALTKVTGDALILIAPGLYQNGLARGWIQGSDSNLLIKGAGPGTVLQDSEGNALILLEASNVAFEDLTLISTSLILDGNAILGSGGAVKQNIRISRCVIKGMKVAVSIPKFQGIIIQDSMIDARNTALMFGNQQNQETEAYSCLASNSDFRAINPTETDSQVVVADGGELTAINCNVTGIAAFTPRSTKRYIGVQALHGGQAVLTNCSMTVDAGVGVSGTLSTHDGLDATDSASRLKLTACSVLAKGGQTNRSIVPNPGAAARMQADASLLTPAWSAV